jgi:hypothetical protein
MHGSPIISIREMQRRNKTAKLLPRLRIVWTKEVALGPGKADLLTLVGETGSIRDAAQRMRMSYMRAWKLIQTMNACFCEPLSERRLNFCSELDARPYAPLWQ